jgi:hypothetical protein
MRELKCSAAEFYAVLGELIDDGIVIEDGELHPLRAQDLLPRGIAEKSSS